LLGLPDRRVLHVAAPDRPDDARHHALLDVVVQDVIPPARDAAGAALRRLRLPVEARHVRVPIAGPALTADIRGKTGIAVGEDIEAGDRLLGDVDRERVLVLLAETRLDHRLEKAAQPEIFGVPARPWQGPGDGGR